MTRKKRLKYDFSILDDLPIHVVFIIFVIVFETTASPVQNCVGFYTLKTPAETGTDVIFWPPKPRHFLGQGMARGQAELLNELTRTNGPRKVFSPEIVRTTMESMEDSGANKYMAHKLMLGHFLTSQIYTDALVLAFKVKAIDTIEEATAFIETFATVDKLNPASLAPFKKVLTDEFAAGLDRLINQDLDHKKIQILRSEYDLSNEDIVQLSKNLATLKADTVGGLNVAVVWPLLLDSEITLKLVSAAFSPKPNTALAIRSNATLAVTDSAAKKPVGPLRARWSNFLRHLFPERTSPQVVGKTQLEVQRETAIKEQTSLKEFLPSEDAPLQIAEIESRLRGVHGFNLPSYDLIKKIVPWVWNRQSDQQKYLVTEIKSLSPEQLIYILHKAPELFDHYFRSAKVDSKADEVLQDVSLLFSFVFEQITQFYPNKNITQQELALFETTVDRLNRFAEKYTAFADKWGIEIKGHFPELDSEQHLIEVSNKNKAQLGQWTLQINNFLERIRTEDFGRMGRVRTVAIEDEASIYQRSQQHTRDQIKTIFSDQTFPNEVRLDNLFTFVLENGISRDEYFYILGQIKEASTLARSSSLGRALIEEMRRLKLPLTSDFISIQMIIAKIGLYRVADWNLVSSAEKNTISKHLEAVFSQNSEPSRSIYIRDTKDDYQMILRELYSK